MSLAEKIRKLRKLRGLTQRQFALEVGASQQAVAKWEKGSYPNYESLQKLECYLDIHLTNIAQKSDFREIPYDLLETRVSTFISICFIGRAEPLWFSCSEVASGQFKTFLKADFLSESHSCDWYTIHANNNALLSINCERIKSVKFFEDPYDSTDDIEELQWIFGNKGINIRPLNRSNIEELCSNEKLDDRREDFPDFEHYSINLPTNSLNLDPELVVKITSETEVYYCDGTRTEHHFTAQSVAAGLAMLNDQYQVSEYLPPKLISFSDVFGNVEELFNPNQIHLIKSPALQVSKLREESRFRMSR
jgi:transcriptional regulator with XRE-family HTH domain